MTYGSHSDNDDRAAPRGKLVKVEMYVALPLSYVAHLNHSGKLVSRGLVLCKNDNPRTSARWCQGQDSNQR